MVVRNEIGPAECFICWKRLSSFRALAYHVLREHSDVPKTMAEIAKGEVIMGKSISDMRSERGGGGPPMLHGSDLGRTEASVKIKIKELREAPKNFNSPAIIDLAEPVHEKLAFAVNITNLRALAVLAGFNDDDADFDKVAERVKGKTFTLYKSMVNNPKTNKMTSSLFFDAESK